MKDAHMKYMALVDVIVNGFKKTLLKIADEHKPTNAALL